MIFNYQILISTPTDLRVFCETDRYYTEFNGLQIMAECRISKPYEEDATNVQDTIRLPR